VRCPLFLL